MPNSSSTAMALAQHISTYTVYASCEIQENFVRFAVGVRSISWTGLVVRVASSRGSGSIAALDHSSLREGHLVAKSAQVRVSTQPCGEKRVLETL